MNYIPQSKIDQKNMFESLNIKSIDDLFKDIPVSLKNPKINMDNGIDEITLSQEITNLACSNKYNEYTSFLGAGAYDHYIPAVVDTIISRSEFYTAYTPYQPEMSQGLLQAIFEYQTMICELTGLDISNASLYDGATAIWEAILIAIRTSRKKEIIILEPINPNYKQVLETYAKFSETCIKFIDFKDHKIDYTQLENTINNNTAGIIVQYPNFLGIIENLNKIGELAKKNKALFIAVCNPIALALFETPAEMGADIIVGEGQPLGIPLSFGGPYLGFISARKKLLRQIPGRIAGQTLDKDGKKGFVLTIQTREQHIRREKAISNICSNQTLMALAASVYLAYMGKHGLKQIAEICFTKCFDLKQKLNKLENIKIHEENINFNEFVIELKEPVNDFIKKAKTKNIIPGLHLKNYNNMKNHLLIAVTEKITEQDIKKLLKLF